MAARARRSAPPCTARSRRASFDDAPEVRGRHLALVRHDGQPGDGTAVRQRLGRRACAPSYTSPTNIGTYLWSTIAARDLDLISPAQAQARIDRDADDRCVARAPRAEWAVLQLVRPGHRRQVLTVWPADGSPRLSVPLQRRQRLAGRSPDDGRRNAVPELAARGARPSESTMDFGFYYDPDDRPVAGRRLDRAAARTALRTITAADRRLLHVPPLRHAQHRAADRQLHRASHAARVPRDALLQDVAHVPRHLRLELAGAATRRESRGRTSASRFSRAHYAYRGMQHRPELGRKHVRGSDGAAARARGAVGSAQLGRQPPALCQGADRARPGRSCTTGTGGSRPRTTPTAATASTASTRSASTLTDTPPTRSGTLVDRGFGDCRPPQPEPSRHTAAALSPHTRRSSRSTSSAIRRSRTWRSCAATSTPMAWAASTTRSTSSPAWFRSSYLALDQGMIMAAIANELTHDRLQSYFAREVETAVRPVIGMEEFTAGG